jgi:hypothetical protein
MKCRIKVWWLATLGSEDEVRQVDPQGRGFIKFNTPEDYQAALHQWQSHCNKTCRPRCNAHVLALTYPWVIFTLQCELKI